MCAFIYYISLWACLAHKTTPMKRTLAVFYILFIACFASYAGVKTKRFQFIGKHYTRSGREHNESITRVIFHQGGSSPGPPSSDHPLQRGKVSCPAGGKVSGGGAKRSQITYPPLAGVARSAGGGPQDFLVKQKTYIEPFVGPRHSCCVFLLVCGENIIAEESEWIQELIAINRVHLSADGSNFQEQ